MIQTLAITYADNAAPIGRTTEARRPLHHSKMRRGPFLAILLCGGAAVALAVTAAGPLMSKTEQPQYTVQEADGPIELRAYPPLLVASVTIAGSRQSALQSGFQTLASYIFGANDGGKKIAMTAPVLEQRSTSSDQTKDWTIRFVMPGKWSLDNLPRAKNDRVRLEKMSTATFAVIRFSGFWRDGLLKMKTEELKDVMARKGWRESGPPVYAFYNPPWTLPFLRRNEIMIKVGTG